MSVPDCPYKTPIPRSRCHPLPGLALVLWLALVQPREAAALHPPPAFVAGSDNPFGLTDVGSESTPSFADLDGDGDLDAFIGAENGNIRFFQNTGTVIAPAFAAAIDNPFGLADVGTYSAPSFADLDGDGDLDAFVGENFGTAQFFQNTGSAVAPAFDAAVDNPFGFTDVGSQSKPAFADLDGDGDLDAFFGEGNGNIKFFENTGSGIAPAFDALVDNPFGLTEVGDYSAPSFADLDGDGDLDAFLGRDTGNTTFFENTGTAIAPEFAAAVDNPFGLADVGTYSAPSFADLDGDGDLDAFFGEFGGSIKFFENTRGPASPDFASSYVLADSGRYSTPRLVDLDGDGDLDAFSGDLNGDMRFLENTGTAVAPAFAAPSNNPFGFAFAGTSSIPTFADLDGDGDLDVFVGDLTGTTAFFRNTGTAIAPAFAAPTNNPYGLTDVGSLSSPTFVDIDGDGDLDAFIGRSDGRTRFFRNTGTAVAPAFAGATTNPFGLADVGQQSVPAFADLDGDGDFDAFISEQYGRTNFFENTGTARAPAFASPVLGALGLGDVGDNSNPSFADFDGDGDLDAFIGEFNGNINVFENTTPVPVELMAFEIE